MAILEAVERRLSETHTAAQQQQQAAGGAAGAAGQALMRLSLMREAALLALGSISDHLAEAAAAQDARGSKGQPPPGSVRARVQAILTDALTHDLQVR
jgi:hypothetical protein